MSELSQKRGILAAELINTANEKLSWSGTGIKTSDEIDKLIEAYTALTGPNEARRVQEASRQLPYVKQEISRILERVNTEILRSKGIHRPWDPIYQEELLDVGSLFGLKSRKLEIDWSYLSLNDVIDANFKIFTKIHTHKEAFLVTFPETDVAHPLICLADIRSPVTRQRIQRIFDLSDYPSNITFWAEETIVNTLYKTLKRLKKIDS